MEYDRRGVIRYLKVKKERNRQRLKAYDVTRSQQVHELSRNASVMPYLLNPFTPNIKEQILLSCPCTFLIKVLGKKLLEYQENSPWVIISLILMTSGVE